MTPYAGIDVMVIGATGFIGRWVADALSRAGARVLCAVRDADTMRRLAQQHRMTVDVATVDVTDANSVAALCSSHPVSVIFNLAGYGIDRTEVNAALAQRINADLVGELVAISGMRAPQDEWRGHRLVHVGSALEYGPIGGDFRETAAAQPNTLYGQTKLAGTEHTRGRDGTMTARLFTVYGPGEHAGRLLPTILDARASAEFVSLSSGGQSRDFAYVEDVAEGLLRLGAADDLSDCPVNLATGELLTVRAFAGLAAAVAGIDAARLRFGARAGYADETPHASVSIERLRSAVRWSPAARVDRGVARTIARLDEFANRPGAEIA